MRNWDLFREMEQFHRDIDEVFHGTGSGRMFRPFESDLGGRHFPRVNLREDNDNIYVEALLPGVDPNEVEISMLGNTLTISGERQLAADETNGRIWHRRERSFGKFLRTIELPVNVDVNKINAEAKHGLLRITLPKMAEAKPKRIDIKVR